jgi:anti-sigma factor RsiW
MRCEEFLEQLSAFLDGEVPPEQARLLTSHAAECDRCGREMQWWVRSTEVVATGLPRIEPSPQIWAGVLRELQPSRQSVWGHFLTGPRAAFAVLAASFALVATIAGGVWWLSRGQLNESRFQHELSAYIQQRAVVVTHGNPFQPRPQPQNVRQEDPENPFSPYLRTTVRNPFKETE